MSVKIGNFTAILFAFLFLGQGLEANSPYYEKARSLASTNLNVESNASYNSCLEQDGTPVKCNGLQLPKKKAEKFGPSIFPVLGKNPFNLNRFYFVRHCDTPESIAEMIYGSKSRVADILRWNKNRKWQPGSIIFFQSPVFPKDKKIMSLYDEHPGRTETYVVRRGDNLQKISQTLIGDYRSWKDIAFYNGLQSPDSLVVGQKLKLKYLR